MDFARPRRRIAPGDVLVAGRSAHHGAASLLLGQWSGRLALGRWKRNMKLHVRLTLLFNLYEAMRISVESMSESDPNSLAALCQLIEHAADDMALLVEGLDEQQAE